MGVGGQRHASAALPPGNSRYPLYMRLGGPQGQYGRVWKISTFQPVACRYTDCAVQAHDVLANGSFIKT